MALIESRSVRDCLRNSSSRARYDSAAVPVQSGNELDASVASRSSRCFDMDVSLALTSSWVVRTPARQWHGMPGVEAKVLMRLNPSPGINGYVIDAFIAILEHIGRLPKPANKACGRRTGEKHDVGVSSLKNQQKHADMPVDNFLK